MNIKQLNYTLIYPQILVAAVKFFLGNDEADVESDSDSDEVRLGCYGDDIQWKDKPCQYGN